MTFWKSVWRLVGFELKHSRKQLGLELLLAIVLVLMIYKAIPPYIESATMGLDLFFTLGFVLCSQLIRPKQFQAQRLYSIHYVAPFLITLNQLAVERRVIVAYRLIVYLITNSIFSILLLIGTFPFFHPYLTLSEYMAFSVIWLAIGIYIGAVNPVFEAYSNIAWNIFFALIFGVIFFTIYTSVFFSWYGDGVVGWTMQMAIDYPWSSIIVSIMLAGLGLTFWVKVMERRMKMADYLA